MIFEVSEILFKVLSYSPSSICDLYCRFANDPSTDLSACRVSIYDLYLFR
jgi:hypothetical protein